MTWPHPSTHPPSTHPPNYTPSHGWGSLHRSQIFKQNWNISISSSTIEFWLIPRVPPWGVGVGGWGWWVLRGCPHTHAHAHACMHMFVYDIIGNSQGFPKNPMEAAICMKLSCLPCMHMYACMCTCVGCTPHHPPSPSINPPTPTAAGSPNHQNSISLELIEIIRFCLKILYLWTFLNSYRL